ncbi:MAG: archaellin/type IV pilin N-terminal domain-containing protein [Candidatus Aenigmatarchaeota archaeon]
MVSKDYLGNYPKTLKGISPVIAIILMVMITVVLVAFSYSWLQGTLEDTTKTTGTILTETQKQNQKITIPTLYKCGDDICFELKALTTNSYSIDMNGTTYYINNVPQTIVAWDGGTGGEDCDGLDYLAAGQRCYGKIEDLDCRLGDTFRVNLAWGTETSKSIDGCS